MLMPHSRRSCFGFLGTALVLLALAGSAFGAEPVRVLRVIDGDSLVLDMAGAPQECRLIGIDAPEWGQAPWGERARNRLSALLHEAGPYLKVETDTERFDRHRRLLVYLRDRRNKLINETMIEEGFALAFNKRPNLRHATLFRNAEKRARARQQGIWSADGLKERPGAFRARTKKGKEKQP